MCYEEAPSNYVPRVEMYTLYILYCSEMGQTNIVNSNDFNNIIRYDLTRLIPMFHQTHSQVSPDPFPNLTQHSLLTVQHTILIPNSLVPQVLSCTQKEEMNHGTRLHVHSRQYSS